MDRYEFLNKQVFEVGDIVHYFGEITLYHITYAERKNNIFCYEMAIYDFCGWSNTFTNICLEMEELILFKPLVKDIGIFSKYSIQEVSKVSDDAKFELLDENKNIILRTETLDMMHLGITFLKNNTVVKDDLQHENDMPNDCSKLLYWFPV